MRLSIVAALVGIALAGCGAQAGRTVTAGIPARLLAQARPIGRGPRFRPPAHGPVIGPCRARLGPRRGVHVEVFAANRVVVIPAGIGVRGPGGLVSGRIASARCYGALVTLEPTGVVLIRAGTRLRVADLFRSWGEPLSPRRVASFAGTGQVRAYVGGRPRSGPVGRVPLIPHSEIVIEIGPYVPPHPAYTFPPGA